MSVRVERRPVLDLLAAAPIVLTCFGALLLFAVPASLLDAMGIAYTAPNGSPLEKVHPGTDLILVAFALKALRAGNPLRYIAEQCRRFPALVLYLGVVVLLIVYLIKVQGAPFTPIIDTFIMPAFLFVLMVDLPKRADAALEFGLHVLLAVNAVIGIIEFLTGWRMFPVMVNGVEFTAEIEWRAYGILGHPLTSAAIAGMYSIILALGFVPALRGWLRGGVLALQLMSLAAFGGRTALVMTLLCLAVIVAMHAAAVLGGRRFHKGTAALILLIVPLVAVALGILASNGFFDLMLSRFVDDNGSAKSRAIIFNIFSYLSWQEFLFGPDQDHINTILHLEGIEVGVESFWLGFIVLCGLVMSILVFAAFTVMVVLVMQRVDRLAFIPLVFFLVIISTTISLSSKSPFLGQFMVMVMILMPARKRLADASQTVRPSRLIAA